MGQLCIVCGREFKGYSWRKSKYCSMACRDKDWHNAHANDCRLSDERKQRTQESNERKRLERRVIALLKQSIKQRTPKPEKPQRLPVIRMCNECGCEFVASSSRNIYCSHVCYKRANNRISTARKDRRLHQNGKPDLSITLAKLYERDGGRCRVCGIVCDWHDINVKEDGVMIAGETYPSVDHVLPVAKGGKHEWSNVQLLCRHCNSIKGDRQSPQSAFLPLP